MRTPSLLLIACLLPLATRAAEPAPVTANVTNVFQVSGMVCEGCAKGITSELLRAPGVASAQVSLADKRATVAYDTNRTDRTQLVEVIKKAGYQAQPASP
jgi:copper chaperone